MPSSSTSSSVSDESSTRPRWGLPRTEGDQCEGDLGGGDGCGVTARGLLVPPLGVTDREDDVREEGRSLRNTSEKIRSAYAKKQHQQATYLSASETDCAALPSAGGSRICSTGRLGKTCVNNEVLRTTSSTRSVSRLTT